MDGRPIGVLLVAASTVLAVKALLEPPDAAPRTSPVPRAVEWGARCPLPSRLADRAAVTHARLAAAGWDRDITPRGVGAARVAALAAGLLVCLAGALLAPVAAVAGVGLAAWGWWSPVRRLRAHGRARRARIARQLPDLLDVLGMCVDTGMAADPALRAVAARLRGPLPAEIAHALDDISLGASRRAAYAALAERVDLDAMGRVVRALLDADELGAPLGRTLRTQAAHARDDARRAAHRRAASAGPRIQLVIALVMVPAALLMVLAVMTSEMVRQIAPVFQSFG